MSIKRTWRINVFGAKDVNLSKSSGSSFAHIEVKMGREKTVLTNSEAQDLQVALREATGQAAPKEQT